MTEQNFCVACGCSLGPGMQFCPQCGKPIEGAEGATSTGYNPNEEFEKMRNQGTTSFLMIALLVYAIPAIVGGILLAIDSSALANTIYHNVDFARWMTEHHFTFTQADLSNYIMIIGALEIISGALATASAVLVYKHVKRMIAFGLCLAAAVICIWSFFGMFLGILVAIYIYSSNYIFTDETS